LGNRPGLSHQAFSIVDRTSFAVMHGSAQDKAFEVVRSGHSPTFLLFHQAILNRQQVTCLYKGRHREICPHILGHNGDQETALVYQFAERVKAA
jgi:hypothetical protein